MKPSFGTLVRVQPQMLWSAALVGCLLVPLVFLGAVRQSSQPLSIMNLQVSIVHSNEAALLAGGDAGRRSRRPTSDGDDAALPVENTTISSGDVGKPTQVITEETSSDGGWSSDGAALSVQQANSSLQTSDDQPTLPVVDTTGSPPSGGAAAAGGAPSSTGDEGGGSHNTERTAPESRIICDLSQIRTDICDLYGDVRIDGSSSSVILATSTPSAIPAGNASWRIRPYARKWETNTMAQIKEFSVRAAAAAGEDTPSCAANHTVPAVVFSTGGLTGNFFHDMADVLVPLFLTTYHYHGEVQFLITQYKSSWVAKYQAILRRLSHYQLLDADADGRVHCFPQATVGLRSHKELGIDPAMAPAGYSMADFRRFLRSCYSLKREYPLSREAAKRPRLLFLSRRGSRSLLNEREVFRMARRLACKVIIATPQAARNMSQFAHTVNSCDVMVGVHGAGLTNMVFLPTNATLVQIIPFGELKYPCRFPYGDPAVDMGMRYLEYEVSKEESSLIRQYPKDHPVLTDPLSIHKLGFPAVWSTFIDKQNVTVNVNRFRSVLVEALRPYGQN